MSLIVLGVKMGIRLENTRIKFLLFLNDKKELFNQNELSPLYYMSFISYIHEIKPQKNISFLLVCVARFFSEIPVLSESLEIHRRNILSYSQEI